MTHTPITESVKFLKMKRALVSVWDKRGLHNFVKFLNEIGVDVISSGGTYEYLKSKGLRVRKVEDVTKFPEILDGRVKTLHPKIHGGILARRDSKEHMESLKENEIPEIDMVVVNLYPFTEVISREHTLKNAIENIDIGGPALLRAAAKNYENVVVICKVEQYQKIIDELKAKGEITIETRKKMAAEAFRTTCIYDAAIQNYLSDEILPQKLIITAEKVMDLRYGENPHQLGALYKEIGDVAGTTSSAKQLHGKHLSFNNYLDMNDAIELVKEFNKPCAAVIKHTNPCGVSIGETIEDAYGKASSVDPKSSFGGIVGLNREVGEGIAKKILRTFIEVIIAPSYTEKALKILKRKKNLRVMEVKSISNYKGYDVKKIKGGYLVQTYNDKEVTREILKVVTKRKPTNREIEDLLFAVKVVKHVKSNAIVLAKNQITTGIGAGQMSRVDAVEIAVRKSNGKCKESVMASDAFFPFRDGIDVAASAGITAIIQPGGSIRDKEVIDAADENGISMVFTGIRYFKH